MTQYLYNVTTGELLFADGFESGDTCEWSDTVGGPVCQMASVTSADWYWARDYIYRDGQLLVEIDGGEVLHLHLDHLGSLRQATDAGGEWVEDHDFLPFGEEVTDPGPETMLFTGHERDHHTGSEMDDLDYMHARYYSPHVGRFLSVDRVAGNLRAAQSWNKYAYVVNNPLKYVDPSGLTPAAGIAGAFFDLCFVRGACSDGFITVTASASSFNPLTGVQGTSDLVAGRSFLDSLFGGLDFLPELIRSIGFNTNAIPTDVVFIGGEFRNAGPSAGELAAGAVAVAVAATVIGNRNPAQDKELSAGEIKAMKDRGVDPEELKGGTRTGRWNLFKDQKGNIYVKPWDGSGPGEPTGFNINDFKKR